MTSNPERAPTPAPSTGPRIEDLAYVHLFDMEDGPPPRKLVGPFGSPAGLTLFFGDGGSGKSIVVETLALSVASGRALIKGVAPTLTGPAGWLDFENRGRQTRNRAGRLLEGRAPVIYIACGNAIWDERDRIRAICAAEGIALLVVDSVGYAVGSVHGPKDDEAARYFAMAVHDLGLPTFAIAHVPKSGADPKRPYGSAFWHNGATQTWSVEKTGVAGHLVRLRNHKDNDGQLADPVSLRIDWGERIRIEPDSPVPGDDHLVAVVESLGIATSEQVIVQLRTDGWTIAARALPDRLLGLVRQGRIRQSGKTKGTRWLAAAQVPQDPMSNAGDGPSPGLPYRVPNRASGGGSRARRGAE